MSEEQRVYINLFKLPLHLNRALCRIKTENWDDAHWDCSEALRLEPDNVKGLYRRGIVEIAQCRREMAKERAHEYWDIENAEAIAAAAEEDLLLAQQQEPNDPMIRAALKDLARVKAELTAHNSKYTRDQKKLYSHLFTNLNKENSKLKQADVLLQNMPPLEPFTIPPRG